MTDLVPANDRNEADKRRLRKFLARSAPGLGQPIIDLRDLENGMLAMQLVWQDGRAVELRRPSLDPLVLDGIVVQCRVFFAAQEDCYLPGIVKALQRLSPSRARALDPLKQHVAQIVRDGRIVAPEGGAPMYSGRLEMDNGLGPDRLLGSDQVTMDYIYGYALHEDDERRARLENVPNMDSVRFAVLLQLDSLLRIVANVRAQVEHDVAVGHITL